MGLSKTELKALRDYPERFDLDGQDAAPDGSKYGLYTYLNTGNCSCDGHVNISPNVVVVSHVECYCAHEQVFSIVADDAASFHKQVKEMECCPCCGTWYQGN